MGEAVADPLATLIGDRNVSAPKATRTRTSPQRSNGAGAGRAPIAAAAPRPGAPTLASPAPAAAGRPLPSAAAPPTSPTRAAATPAVLPGTRQGTPATSAIPTTARSSTPTAAPPPPAPGAVPVATGPLSAGDLRLPEIPVGPSLPSPRGEPGALRLVAGLDEAPPTPTTRPATARPANADPAAKPKPAPAPAPAQGPQPPEAFTDDFWSAAPGESDLADLLLAEDADGPDAAAWSDLTVLDEGVALGDEARVSIREHPLGAWMVGVDSQIRAASRFPEELRALGVDGDVVVRFRVAKDGTVSEARVLRGSDVPELDLAALAAIPPRVPALPAGEKGRYVTYTFRYRAGPGGR